MAKKTAGKVLLIIEDDRDIAEMERVAFEMFGYQVRVLVDLTKALDVESYKDVDVAIIDLMLPGIYGGDIAKFLKQRLPHIRRVVLTAKINVDPETQAAADVLLFKPASLVEMRRAIEGVGNDDG